MYAGECIPGTFGSLDCSKDMLLSMDVDCSGRKQCSVSIIDLVKSNPDLCTKGLSMFLDATYTCLDGN
jgi:hypothetical protein